MYTSCIIICMSPFTARVIIVDNTSKRATVYEAFLRLRIFRVSFRHFPCKCSEFRWLALYIQLETAEKHFRSLIVLRYRLHFGRATLFRPSRESEVSRSIALGFKLMTQWQGNRRFVRQKQVVASALTKSLCVRVYHMCDRVTGLWETLPICILSSLSACHSIYVCYNLVWAG